MAQLKSNGSHPLATCQKRTKNNLMGGADSLRKIRVDPSHKIPIQFSSFVVGEKTTSDKYYLRTYAQEGDEHLMKTEELVALDLKGTEGLKFNPPAPFKSVHSRQGNPFD